MGDKSYGVPPSAVAQGAAFAGDRGQRATTVRCAAAAVATRRGIELAVPFVAHLQGRGARRRRILPTDVHEVRPVVAPGAANPHSHPGMAGLLARRPPRRSAPGHRRPRRRWGTGVPPDGAAVAPNHGVAAILEPFGAVGAAFPVRRVAEVANLGAAHPHGGGCCQEDGGRDRYRLQARPPARTLPWGSDERHARKHTRPRRRRSMGTGGPVNANPAAAPSVPVTMPTLAVWPCASSWGSLSDGRISTWGTTMRNEASLQSAPGGPPARRTRARRSETGPVSSMIREARHR